MTRLEMITRAGRQLGDTSTEFLVLLRDKFDDTMRDLQAEDALEPNQLNATFTTVADQRTYSVLTIVGGSYLPVEVLRLTVPEWNAQVLRAGSTEEFESYRFGSSEDLRGRFRLWRLWPNIATLEVWPPAHPDEPAATAELTYIKNPAQLVDGDTISSLQDHDLETLMWGIVHRASTFRDENAQDGDRALEMYLSGKARMYARRHNHGVKRIAPDYY